MTGLLRLSAGLIAWAVGFGAIYALHGIGCAGDWPARTVGGFELHRAAMIAAWAATIALNIAIAVRLSGRRDDALDRAAAITSWTGVAATAVTVAPILSVASCL